MIILNLLDGSGVTLFTILYASVDPHDYEVDGKYFAKHIFKFYFNLFAIGFYNSQISLCEILNMLWALTDVMEDEEENKIKVVLTVLEFLFLWFTIIAVSIYFFTSSNIFIFNSKFFGINGVWCDTTYGSKRKYQRSPTIDKIIRLNPIFSFIYWKMNIY